MNPDTKKTITRILASLLIWSCSPLKIQAQETESKNHAEEKCEKIHNTKETYKQYLKKQIEIERSDKNETLNITKKIPKDVIIIKDINKTFFVNDNANIYYFPSTYLSFNMKGNFADEFYVNCEIETPDKKRWYLTKDKNDLMYIEKDYLTELEPISKK